MMRLLYDGSFEGFLSLVYKVYYEKLKVNEILSKQPNELFTNEIIEVQTNEEHYNKVLTALQNKFPKKAFETILNTFMCDTKAFELNLLNYIILGFKDKNELYNINNPSIFYMQNLQKELFSLVHKMTGFTRFEELEDKTLYAKVETKFNIVYFLGKHFYKRLNNQNYIIHDLNRKLAFIKNNSYVGVQNIASFETPILSKDEAKFKKLWAQFFNSVSIDSRKNYKVQRNMVPLLYRTYMNEFKDFIN